MKTLIKLFYWLAGLFAVLLIVAYLLPKTYKVERDISIKSKPEVIYGLVSNFAGWHIWVPWTKEMDSTAVFTTAGPSGEVGQTWAWEGKKMGQGEMVASEQVPGQLLAYDLAFDHGKYKSRGRIKIDQAGDSCKVSWTDDGDLGYNPVARYMGLFMDKMMGPDFEKGLAKLKSVAEARAGWPKIELTRIPGQTVLLIRDSAGPQTYSSVMGRAFGEIMTFAQAGKLSIKGSPFAIYLRWDSVTMFSVMDIGMPVEMAENAKGRIRIEKLPEQKALVADYFGPYEKTADVYRFLDQKMKECGFTEAGGPWEIYITDPTMEKDTARWETQIVFPVK
jgi:effector-binding domain-containing protein